MDLYNELRSGRTADEIAKAFTEQLNAAEARIKDEEAKAAEEAKRAAALKAEAKRHDMVALLDQAMTFLSTHYPDMGVNVEELSDGSLVALADFFISLLDMEALRYSRKNQKLKVDFQFDALPKKTAAAPALDDVFADFFKSIGL